MAGTLLLLLTLAVALSGCATGVRSASPEASYYAYSVRDENGTIAAWYNMSLDATIWYPLGADGEFHTSRRVQSRIEAPGFSVDFQNFFDVATGLGVLSVVNCHWPVTSGSCTNPYAQIEWGPRSGSADILLGAPLVDTLGLRPGTIVILAGTPLERTIVVTSLGPDRLRVSPDAHTRRTVGCNFLDDDTIVEPSTGTILECSFRPGAQGGPPFVTRLEARTGSVRPSRDVAQPPPGPGRLAGPSEPMNGIEPAASNVRLQDEITLAEALAEARRNASGFNAFLHDHPAAAIAQAGLAGRTEGNVSGAGSTKEEYTIRIFASATEGHEVVVARTTLFTPAGTLPVRLWSVERDARLDPSTLSLYSLQNITRPESSANLRRVHDMVASVTGGPRTLGPLSITYRFTLDPADFPAYTYFAPIGSFCTQPGLCVENYIMFDGLQARFEKAHVPPEKVEDWLFWKPP